MSMLGGLTQLDMLSKDRRVRERKDFQWALLSLVLEITFGKARIVGKAFKFLTLLDLTLNKWITSVSRRATADWVVIENLAASVNATSAWTWVYTLLVHACLIL
jgi:hypothetical protein